VALKEICHIFVTFPITVANENFNLTGALSLKAILMSKNHVKTNLPPENKISTPSENYQTYLLEML
jgi:hypothetical protein